MKSHKNDIRYQAYRSQARNLSTELIRGQPDLLREGIDPLQVRFEPITNEAIEASLLWGEESELYPWEDVPSWMAKDRKGGRLRKRKIKHVKPMALVAAV